MELPVLIQQKADFRSFTLSTFLFVLSFKTHTPGYSTCKCCLTHYNLCHSKREKQRYLKEVDVHFGLQLAALP